MSLRLSALWLLAALLGTLGCNCGGAEIPEPNTGSQPTSPPLPPTAPLPETTERGVCYAHSYEDRGSRGYGSTASEESLRELREHNVTWVSLTPFGFMRSLQSTEVRLVGNHPSGERDERMEREFGLQRAAGIQVMLKPHVWIGGGGFRGNLDPGSPEGWNQWFDSYREFILHYARMARDANVGSFVVGVEFDQTTTILESRWRELIQEVRAIYDGPLLYAANWDKVGDVPFWDAVDAIGVQFYPPVGQRTDGEADKRLRLEAHLDALGELSRAAERPVVLTEVGYRPIASTDERPYAWPSADENVSADPAAQERAYARLLSALSARPFVTGIYIWKWFTDANSTEEGESGFSPRGQPAAEVLRQAYRSASADR